MRCGQDLKKYRSQELQNGLGNFRLVDGFKSPLALD
jgi:hypothetical protein